MINYRQYIKESLSNDIDKYLEQINSGEYSEATNELYDFISTEGWLSELEEFYNTDYSVEDFEYLILDISDKDRNGLIHMDESVVNKFNDLDIKIKEITSYPYDVLDFIDYDKGKVYIIRLI